jgi:mycothiol synthase
LGFCVGEVRFVLGLDPSEVDLSRFSDVEDSVARLGIVISSLMDFPLGPQLDELVRRIYELDIAATADEPGQVESAPTSFEAWQADFIEGHEPEGVIVAFHSGVLVGLCIHWDEDDEILIASTGVAREWRGRGVATAMKLAGVQYALKRQKHMRTFNSAENAAVLKINANLGFVRKTTVRRWQLIRVPNPVLGDPRIADPNVADV